MPMTSLSGADLSFPTFTGSESEEQKTEKILNYLYMLLENLRYTLGNLDQDNFSTSGIKEIGEVIREPIYARLEKDEKSITELSVSAENLSAKITGFDNKFTQIYADMDSIKLEAYAEGNNSVIQLTGNNIVAKSAIINLSGLVRFTDLSGSGQTTINGDNIVSGTITGTTFRSLYDDEIAGSFECYFTDRYEGYYNILSGRIYSYYNTDPSGNKIPALYISASENKYVDCALKLLSSAGTSIESGGTVYIESGGGHGITLVADGDGTGNINLNGNVYINGRLIS